MPERIIFHVDMDAFFASVEQRDNPKLKDKPIAVIGSNNRTVLVSPSYKARSYGVKTGMTQYQAKALCPDIVFVRASTEKYTRDCGRILRLLYSFTPDVEVYSIDEFFLDITHTKHLFGSPAYIANMIRDKITKGTGLSASIGISHNKLLAKLASDMAKPAGIKFIKKDTTEKMLSDKQVGVLCGIGPKTEIALNRMGIETLGQLRKSSAALLKKRFGINGARLILMAKGIDDSPVIPVGEEEEAKSMGHSMTLAMDTKDTKELSRFLLELTDKVCRRLRHAGLSAKTVRLTIRYKSFKTFSRQKKLVAVSDDTKLIYKTALSIFHAINLKEPVRLVGVGASGLVPSFDSGSLFKEEKRKYKLNRLLDYVNDRFGESAVSFASLLEPSGHKRIISPAWRPYGRRKY